MPFRQLSRPLNSSLFSPRPWKSLTRKKQKRPFANRRRAGFTIWLRASFIRSLLMMSCQTNPRLPVRIESISCEFLAVILCLHVSIVVKYKKSHNKLIAPSFTPVCSVNFCWVTIYLSLSTGPKWRGHEYSSFFTRHWLIARWWLLTLFNTRLPVPLPFSLLGFTFGVHLVVPRAV